MLFLQGNVIDCLKTLPDQSIHCCITSPPYWNLRNYSTNPQIWGGNSLCEHEWNSSFCSKCGAWKGELGLEPTPELYVEHLVMVFREVKRVLRDDGCLFLNLGDSYYNNFGGGSGTCTTGNAEALRMRGRHSVPKHETIKMKDLIGIPWMTAFALRSDGWYLRSDTIWAKGVSGQGSIWKNVYNACLENKIPKDVAKKIADSANPYVGNPMPESVKDRPTRSHEYIFLLTKSQKYFYDHVAVQEDCAFTSIKRITQTTFDSQTGGEKDYGKGINKSRSARRALENFARKQNAIGKRTYEGFNCRYEPVLKRNLRDTWVIPTQPYSGAHFAVMPESLAEPCINAATSEKGCCPKCGSPFVRKTEKRVADVTNPRPFSKPGNVDRNDVGNIYEETVVHTIGWQPTCSCGLDPIPCTTLDPFGGSGTVAKVSRDLGRNSIYIDLNPQYVDMAMKRVGSSLFNSLERKVV